jgi:hypothetical protein
MKILKFLSVHRHILRILKMELEFETLRTYELLSEK